MTIELTQETFAATVKQGIVLIDWWAAWCGPCRAFAPVFAQAAGRHRDITFAKVDTEAEPVLAGAFAISAIPTLMAFRDGILVFEQPGALPAAALDRLIEAVRALDMDDVRRQIADSASPE
ncbi:MAG TPA: thioredoxin domain-containing protein [Kofleriaceae bacterium]|nr:thioredoxin domain-containing protein [Kofleriaceae bacterium]